MAPTQRNNVHKGEVKALSDDYARSNEQLQQQEKAKRKHKIFLRRRLVVYFIAAAILFFGLTKFLFYQNDRLAIKEAELATVQQKMDETKEQQEMLKLQISRLEDDDYIAKLARKEYFLSEEGEIIFTMPEATEEEESDE